MRSIISLLAAGAALGSTIAAAEPSAAVRETVALHDAVIEKEFKVNDVVTGYVVKSERARGLIYDIAGEFAVIGSLHDDEGRNVSLNHQGEHMYDLATAFKHIKDDAKLIKDKEHETLPVYGIYEPYCPHCAAAIIDFAAQGIHINWLPVQFLNERSSEVMSVVYQADMPMQMLVKSAEAKAANGIEDFLAEHPVTPSDKDFMAKRLKKHTEWMFLAGINGTPAFIMEVDGKPQIVGIETVVGKYGKKETAAN